MPIEFRWYVPLFTMADLENGLQAARMGDREGRVRMYAPPILQYRVKHRLAEAGKTAWGEWITVPYVREGDDMPQAKLPLSIDDKPAA